MLIFAAIHLVFLLLISFSKYLPNVTCKLLEGTIYAYNALCLHSCATHHFILHYLCTPYRGNLVLRTDKHPSGIKMQLQLLGNIPGMGAFQFSLFKFHILQLFWKTMHWLINNSQIVKDWQRVALSCCKHTLVIIVFGRKVKKTLLDSLILPSLVYWISEWKL